MIHTMPAGKKLGEYTVYTLVLSRGKIHFHDVVIAAGDVLFLGDEIEPTRQLIRQTAKDGKAWHSRFDLETEAVPDPRGSGDGGVG